MVTPKKDLEETVIISHLYSLLFYVIPRQEYNRHPLLFLLAFAHQSNAGKICPDNWTKGPKGEKCFRFTVAKCGSTWRQSRSTCQKFGDDLAHIDSQETQRFVEALIGDLPAAWLGAKRDENGTVKWINGNRLGYSNWFEGEPSELSSNQCVIFWMVGSKWTLNNWYHVVFLNRSVKVS